MNEVVTHQKTITVDSIHTQQYLHGELSFHVLQRQAKSYVESGKETT